MRKQHILALASAFIMTTAVLHGADVQLGLELPAATLAAPENDDQVDPQLALGPNGAMAVWTKSKLYQVFGSVAGGAPFLIDQVDFSDNSKWIGWPAVAAGNHVFLVAWFHNDLGDKDRVYARRYDSNGQAIDAQPFVLDESTPGGPRDHTAPSIAFDGNGFLVAWARTPRPLPSLASIQTARIGEEGAPGPTISTLISAGGDSFGPRSVRALWTGSEYFVAYTIEHVGHAAGIYVNWEPAALRFSRNNSLVAAEAKPFSSFGLVRADSSTASATLAGTRVSYAWFAADSNGNHDLVVAQTKLDGTATVAPKVVQHLTTVRASKIDILWNGSEHVLTWLERPLVATATTGTLRAMRFDAQLRPIDAQPFDVTSAPVLLDSTLWLSPRPFGVTFAYSRLDDANGGKGRIYTRSLGALAPGSLPDLAIGTAGAGPSPVLAGTDVYITYPVRNIGGSAAPATRTHIEIRRSSDNALLVQADFPTPTVAAGGSITETQAVRIPATAAAGQYTVTVTLDGPSEIAEATATNNAGTATLSVIEAAHCVFTLTPAVVVLSGSGGAGSVQVTVNDPLCNWTVTPEPGAQWLTITSGSGVGNGLITFNAGKNPYPGVSLEAVLTVGNTNAKVRQLPLVPHRRAVGR